MVESCRTLLDPVRYNRSQVQNCTVDDCHEMGPENADAPTQELVMLQAPVVAAFR